MRARAVLAVLAVAAPLVAGCRQDMHDQPKYKPLRTSEFFADGRTSRPVIDGTVARGALRHDDAFFTGKEGTTLVREAPVPFTPALLARGRETYNAFCSPCHDRVGTGGGMIVLRGYKRPPSFHIDRLRNEADGYYFATITNGFGVMPTYAEQIAPKDRWAIVAYIRALQLSQGASAADVPAAERAKLGLGELTVAVTTTSSLVLPAEHPLHRVQRVAVGVGGLGILASVVLGFVDSAQLVRSYLVAWLFWTGGTLGCLALLMINHVTGGGWGVVVRRALEAGARILPVMGLLFVPIALGVGSLYEWANPEHVHHDELLQHKALYLNVPFFIGRTVFYFVAWTLVAWGLVRWSTRQDENADPATDRMELISRGGLVLLGLTMTFAFVDWAMSLEPHWFSTIYGVIWMGGSALTAFAVVIPVAALFALREPTRGLVKREQVHDLGKLLLAFVVLWTYFNLSQFLIIWSGNLPEETTWYLKRLRGGWQYLAGALVVFHFALPFVVLLSRPLKRDPRRLAVVALVLLVVRFLDVFWMVTPAFAPERLTVHLLDLTTLLAVGGSWAWLFVRNLEGRPLLPLRDPSLPVLP